MEDVAVAIQALSNGTMQVLPGASDLCFAFTIPATQLLLYVFQNESAFLQF